MKSFYLFSVIALSLSSFSSIALVKDNRYPKNIIMIVADGMGPAYTSAYRNYADDPSTPAIEPVIFDKILVGNASTYPAPISGYVTDSAAAATALASGVKTYNGAIGVDVDKNSVKSVLQRAKEVGMRTGVVVTSQINHATPAAYLTHDEHRSNYDAIADTYINGGTNSEPVADVILGGGTQYFKRKDNNLTKQFVEKGYSYVESYQSLVALDVSEKVLGLFAKVGLPYALDDSDPHRLRMLSFEAIRHLENPNGYFLLIEASQVDWAGHKNDIVSAMVEMDDLARALESLFEYAVKAGDTLVVLTADHDTGGLSIGANGKYIWEPAYLRGVKSSPYLISKNMLSHPNPVEYVSSQLGFVLTTSEIQNLNEVLNENEEHRENVIKSILDNRTNTGWTTGGHTGVDVEVFAFGPQSEKLFGQIDNTDIPKLFFKLLSKESF
ncbi:alkaline phosphatase [Bowmanella sp. Y26]|uniref:alkaline phosphatase n=1 Tax=Bowmanella yangjiangensis TaxID=2811230 RepID=UPI001BDCABE5|nr:alkaline phosphatase [Bowmanella yangjiangensis]MBT1062321.1 alkaline phosphatase [Bowmanella yangjiangensis]